MNDNYINLLHPNDVIFGRGPVPAAYEGNKRFRVLIRRHRKSYTSGNRLEKQKLGSDILDQIHAVRGRFLKQVDPALAVDAYYEVSEKVALAKIKQALREHRNDSWWLNEGASRESHTKESNLKRLHHKKGKARRLPVARKQVDDLVAPEALPSDGYTHPFDSLMERTSTYSSFPNTPSRVSPSADGSLMIAVSTPSLPEVAENTSSSLQMLPPLTPIEASDDTGMSTFDTRLLLFQNQSFAPQQQAIISRSFATIASHPSERMVLFSSSWDFSSIPGQGLVPRNVESNKKKALSNSHEYSIEHASLDSLVQDLSLLHAPRDMSETAAAYSASSSAFNETLKSTEKKPLTKGPPEEMSEEDVAAFLLNSLAIVDRPAVTEEDEARERALLSTAERAAVVSDTLGIPSERNISHLDKRQRTSHDRKTRSFLVGLLKGEIEKISLKHRHALVEAQMNCGVHEFSDSRLEQFLKAEGMNAKLAALRVVRYWKSRKEVFGNKYLEEMKLSGALRDDLAALQAGVFCLLEPDAYGRYILFLNVARHEPDEYTSDSLLRAVWYLVEVAARDEKNTGIVQVVWFQGATIWDYDLRVYDRLAYMMSNCFPIQFKANHLCRLPRIIARSIKPIIHSFMSKDMRTHSIQHDVPENEIIEVLSNYGLYRNMLPTVMGGDVTLDLTEFVASRYATELEEL